MSPWAVVGLDPSQVVEAGLAVQVHGQLNPLIFHPDWFEKFKLISTDTRNQALEEESLMVIAPGVCRWSSKAIDVNVDNDLLVITTVDETVEHELRLLVRNIFELLPHTPVVALEFERFVHYDVSTDVPASVDLGTPEDVNPSPLVKEKLAAMTAYQRWQSFLPHSMVNNITFSSRRGERQTRATLQPSALSENAVFISVVETIEIARTENEVPVQSRGIDLVEVADKSGHELEKDSRDVAAGVLRDLLELK